MQQYYRRAGGLHLLSRRITDRCVERPGSQVEAGIKKLRARDVGDDAKRRSADYQRTYQGRPVMLGPHFRRGGRQLLRVYCYLDETARRVVVGHVGGHLADRTT